MSFFVITGILMALIVLLLWVSPAIEDEEEAHPAPVYGTVSRPEDMSWDAPTGKKPEDLAREVGA